ncbi:MAG: YicC/YloC family endoribonuclease [Lachnospiraceae bacterium]|nr:YicC/YloC family endoribonuclease [Lachnospiraceae bacterium]
MIKSMTGFGRSEVSGENCKMTVEMKSVNHRYGDISIRMPKKLSFFETQMRSLLKKYIQRGKVDVFVTYEDLSGETVELKYNQTMAQNYLDMLKRMEEEFGVKNDITTTALSRYPEVFTLEEQESDEDELWEVLQQALIQAVTAFVETRTAEGEHLYYDLTGKLDHMLDMVQMIETRSPGIVEEYRVKLEEKVKELLENNIIDDGRIAAEVTIYADKICVDEETVRLRSHIESMKKTLNMEGTVGRKLDFIAQEMNREANTILSKANDLELSNTAIDLKTEIEKVREQIQNIE